MESGDALGGSSIVKYIVEVDVILQSTMNVVSLRFSVVHYKYLDLTIVICIVCYFPHRNKETKDGHHLGVTEGWVVHKCSKPDRNTNSNHAQMCIKYNKTIVHPYVHE